MKTRVDRLLGLKYPLIQGGMAWISDAKLASAVSNAGGLGVIAAGNAPADWVREQIEQLRLQCDKPFGINIMLMSPYAEEVAGLVTDMKVPVVITGAGNPAKYMNEWKEAGIKVMPVVASRALALMMEKMGADAVIAEGSEAGGHIGELTTMILTPLIVDTVQIPVVSAGGICDARTVAAAFCMGADGVQVGTRFILAEECTVHQNYKDKVAKARDTDSKVTGRITGHPVRVLRNNLTRELADLEYLPNGAELLEKRAVGALRAAVVDGDLKEGSFMAGQCACRMEEIQSAAKIMAELFDEQTIKAGINSITEGTSL